MDECVSLSVWGCFSYVCSRVPFLSACLFVLFRMSVCTCLFVGPLLIVPICLSVCTCFLYACLYVLVCGSPFYGIILVINFYCTL
jgi:hypothetical protein